MEPQPSKGLRDASSEGRLASTFEAARRLGSLAAIFPGEYRSGKCEEAGARICCPRGQGRAIQASLAVWCHAFDVTDLVGRSISPGNRDAETRDSVGARTRWSKGPGRRDPGFDCGAVSRVRCGQSCRALDFPGEIAILRRATVSVRGLAAPGGRGCSPTG